MTRTERRVHLTRVLATLARAQAHYDRLGGVPNEEPVRQARQAALEAIVDAFTKDLPATDLRAVQSASRFLADLRALAEKNYSVVEAEFYAEIDAMSRAMEAAADAATAARFSADKALEAVEEQKAAEFYDRLAKHAEKVVHYHGAEFILMIAKADVEVVKGVGKKPAPSTTAQH